MAFGKSSKDPFCTPVGHLIEITTVGTTPSEDWGQFMNICDIINTTEEGPKEAVKALKRRISTNYNHKEVRLSLSLLDMCMENCCTTFQALVVKKDFCKVLVKLLKPKYNLPIVMQNKILHFIMTWSKGLAGGSVDVSDVKEVYLDLVKKGIVFPSTEINGEATFEDHVSSSQTSKQSVSCSASESCSTNSSSAGSTILLSPDQIGKIYSELEVVKTNVTVMSAILLENAPDTTNLEDLDLLQKLNTTCRIMQERIMELLVTVHNDDVTAELIQVNDDLNNAFLRYERFLRSRTRLSEDHVRQAHCTEVDNSKPSAPASDLIDLSSRSLEPPFQTPSPDTLFQATDMDILAMGFENSSNSLTSPEYSNLRDMSASDTVTTKPFLYPQLGLLMLGANGTTPFAVESQTEQQRLPSERIYDNRCSALQSVQEPPPLLRTLEPVSIALEAKPKSEEQPASSAGNMKEASPPPSYYELIEFDPLAETNGTEVIYEEIDKYIFNAEVKSNTEC
ncbi:TOM1-like protein 1 isoform X1 [Ambystoma mexicanum]|uniref:TOM1-like protein 1 isoform X1 n=1 Tax=Ambystoma mexicanum TaxID=8296 RepID=UPI0037E803D1